MPTIVVRRRVTAALSVVLAVGSLATATSPSTATPVRASAASSLHPASATDGGSVSRVGAPDRYALAVRAADTVGLVEPETVVVASGQVFPDALAAGALAARIGAPLLLTRRDGLPPATLEALQQIRNIRYLVVGGPATVSDTVVGQLPRWAGTRRLGGANRYAVAATVARYPLEHTVPVAYVASGSGYADALSAVAPAAVGDGPVLLSRQSSLPTETREVLRTLRPGRIVVLGGPASVSRSVVTALKDYTTGTVTRLGGATRYDVSAAVSEASFEPGARVAYLASGEVFPDALAAGPYAGLQGGPVLLVRKGGVPEPVLEELDRLRPRRIIVLGGPNTISDAVLDAVAGIAQPATASDLSVSPDSGATCAVSAGQAECWGAHYVVGQLGNGTTTDVSVPVPVKGLPSPVAQVSVGYHHACAVDVHGSVWCWGSVPAAGGTLLRPQLVTGLPSATRVSAGSGFSCAVGEDGSVWCLGDNLQDVLGMPGPTTNTPQRVPGILGRVVDVSAGAAHACALTADGDVWCWGSSSDGRTGTDPALGSPVPPTRVDIGGPVATVTASGPHTCATLVHGGVRCFGGNWEDQLGDGTGRDSWEPVTPVGLESSRGAVGSSYWASCLVDGSVSCWGHRFSAVPITQPQFGQAAVQAGLGMFTTCIRTDVGALLCAGAGSGLGVPWTPTSTSEPVRVTGY